MQNESFDPATQVVLAQPVVGRFSQSSQQESVHITHYAPERVEITVVASAPGYLVLADAWYPGWEAAVDGDATEVYRANLLFRAIAMGEGHHQVVFTFRPASLRVGASVSLVGLAVVAGVAFVLYKAHRGVIMKALLDSLERQRRIS
jgi:uncharacterized membrane protein YfhO